MSRPAAIFAAIAASLEGMHGFAIERQAPALSSDEVLPLVARRRGEARRLSRHIVAAGVALNR